MGNKTFYSLNRDKRSMFHQIELKRLSTQFFTQLGLRLIILCLYFGIMLIESPFLYTIPEKISINNMVISREPQLQML